MPVQPRRSPGALGGLPDPAEPAAHYSARSEALHSDQDLSELVSEEVWSRIGRHALYQLNEYISWGAFGPPDDIPRFTDPAQIIEVGAYRLLDGEAAVRELTDLLRGCPQIKDVHFWAQLPGEPVDSGSEHIAYLADKVMPAVRERPAT